MRPNYNYYRQSQNMYYPYQSGNRNDDRFLGSGILAPLVVGGLAGYAIGNNNGYNNNNCCPTPMYFVPANNQFYPSNYPTYYASNNNYYY